MVSVVIPTYKTVDCIAETLDSVFAQSITAIEVIVVNDNDPETSRLEQVLAPYRDRIVYIRHSGNQGASAARNTGIRAATKEWVALLDSDDLWLPHFLEKQLQYLRDNPEFDLVYGNAELFGPRAEYRRFMDKNPSHGEVTFESLVEERCIVLTSSVVGRRSAFIEAGLFDPSFCRSEDFDLWLRMTLKGYRIGYHDEVVLRYRARFGSLSADAEDMYSAAMNVLHRIASHPHLSQEQRELTQKRVLLFEARKNLALSKHAVSTGDYASAREFLSSANLYFRSMRLYAITGALWLTPHLLGWLYNKRFSHNPTLRPSRSQYG
jgi:glycosyltransferase involved in cell wall biosynthesis